MPGSEQSGRLAVVVPLANEEATVDEFLTRVLLQLKPEDQILCVLDSVSQDSTRDRVRRRGESDPRVRLVWAPENRCVVDAYFRGYREALKTGADWVLEMDGGLSHLPEEIPRFVEAMERGVDFAAGSRFVRAGRYDGRVTRYLLSRGGSLLTNLLLRAPMRDMTSGFECFSRRALEHVLQQGVRSRAHFFQTEIRFMLRDWNWEEVPISYSGPSAGVGRRAITEALRNLWYLARQPRAPRRVAGSEAG